MFLGIIKDSIANQFTGTISVTDMGLSLLTAFVVSLFIIFVYKRTYAGVLYSKTFTLCVMMLAMVTALIIRTVNANLSLSLGMVGALSIVRFRTAVKEPVDTGFMFWGISAGIMAGAGLYIIAVVGSVILGILYFVGYSLSFKGKSKYLFILKYDERYDETVKEMVKKINKRKLKTKTITKGIIELTYEIEIKNENTKFMEEFQQNKEFVTVALISYQNEFGD